MAPNPQVYKAYTTKFDMEAKAVDILNAMAPADLHRSMQDTLRDTIRSPTPMRVRAGLSASILQERLLAGHPLGAKPLVTVLIDHSGSMRGLKAQAAAVAADLLGDVLENARIDFEVLGFTTRSWRGGKSRQMWQARGKPKWPGRLCDLLHIVYREAGSVRRNWSRDLTLMMYDEHLRENVDGEALEWARARAAATGCSQWVCLVLSDGVPMDDSTVSANGGPADFWYLNAHLKSVVRQLEREPHVRIGAVKIGDDAPETYECSEDARVVNNLPIATLRLLERLVWPPDIAP